MGWMHKDSWPTGDDTVSSEQMLVLAIADLTATGTKSRSEVYAKLEARVEAARVGANVVGSRRDAEHLREALG